MKSGLKLKQQGEIFNIFRQSNFVPNSSDQSPYQISVPLVWYKNPMFKSFVLKPAITFFIKLDEYC
jgi:hypothetical protein